MEYEVLNDDQRLAITAAKLGQLEGQHFQLSVQLEGLEAQIEAQRSERDALVTAGADASKVQIAATPRGARGVMR